MSGRRQYVEAELEQDHDFELDDCLTATPRALVAVAGYGEDSEVALRVAGLTAAGSAAIVDRFVEALRWFVAEVGGSRPTHPGTTEEVRVTSEQLRSEWSSRNMDVSDLDLKKLRALIQVQALWQAVESYAAGTKSATKLFTKPELKQLKQALPDDLNEAQCKALERMIGRLNEEPLRARLRRRLKSDAVPITERELKVLDDLRDARNDVTHGRDVRIPLDRDTLNYGISIVARMLVHRIAA